MALLFIALALSALVPAQASEKLDKDSGQALVQPFYDFLSGKLTAKEGFANMAEDWRSFSSDNDFRNIAETTTAIEGLRTNVVPNLEWLIHDIVVGERHIVVRGEGRGTPAADFLGLPASGKSFAIMSIDIHEVNNGAVVSTWHVENWAEAIRQLSAQ